MDRTSRALRLVTVEVAALVGAIGEASTASAITYVNALAMRGYVPVPIPWEPGAVAIEGETDLLILSSNEEPVPTPGSSLLRAIAFLENAFHVGRAIGEPGEAQKERIIDIADSLERLSADERSVLGAHYHYMLRTANVKPRPMGLKSMEHAAQDRVIRSLYATVTADGTLYDVIIERLEAVFNAEGLNGTRLVWSLVPARQVVLRYARPEHDPGRWTGLEEMEARLLSWIVARPKASAADLESKARQFGLLPYEALVRIKDWIDMNHGLLSEAPASRSLPRPTDDQRP